LHDMEGERIVGHQAQIKSRARVRDIAEVYTRDEEITAMLDLVGDVSHNIEARFLEPAAGNGNFLVRILERKLASALRMAAGHRKRRELVQKDFEFYALTSLASIYAVDIDAANVKETHDRLRVHLKDIYSGVFNTLRAIEGFYDAVDYILQLNVIQGDMLNGVHLIQFTEFSAPKMYKFTQHVYLLQDLLDTGLFGAQKPKPVKEIPMKNYWELAHV